MTFIACGINHKTAPLTIREKLAASCDEQQMRLIESVLTDDQASEAALLSTCNRTELYCVSESPDTVIDWMITRHFAEDEDVKPMFYSHTGHAGIRHAMRVACGLDSMMLGEPQIFGQFKRAYRIAEDIGSIGATLRPIFHHVFSASKRIRSRTGIGINPTSIAYTSVNLIRQIFANNLHHCHVFMIGAGETSQLVAKYLQQANVEHFTVASRTLAHASQLADKLNGTPVCISDIALQLPQTDIVICATACPMPFISQQLIEEAMAKRNRRPMCLIDLSVPRDIEANVADVPDVHLYNIDDLQHLVQHGLSTREDAANQAEQIIDCEIAEYIDWYHTQQAKESIIQYRQKMHELTDLELTRIKQRLSNGQLDSEQALEELSHRLLQKLCHQPTLGLRRAARDNRSDLLTLADFLFKPSSHS